ncbi:MAG: methionine ABC transporter ATP-binding protein [Corynebacterium sp.]|uniref:methionine ABC transporter ATP-binding protein n=1 Tax=Corynebacterium sp. TaxID=1720 RepID=UPI0026DBC4D5|nr:methionine ABC transporter ATP-binding protein [Corynebacterium sp.]MDO5030119.1 methionine ABC transporter ATP-binding protein [Corynebacterium sp.]
MTNKGTKLEFRELNKQFGDVTALAGINLTVEPGEILGVIGYSGAGKSTLIRMINGLEKPTSGQVLLDDTDIVGISERQLRGLRRNIGMIFQHFNLFHSRNAIRNVEYPLELAGMPKAKRRARAQELLEFVGLGDKAESFPEQLSGGQKQRVGIARALATEPTLLLADEATSALDPETTAGVLDLLRRINREMGVTIVLITHDMSVVRGIADRMAIMEKGRIVETGTVHEVFANPQTEVGRRFATTALRDTPIGRERDSLNQSVQSASARLVTITINDGVDLGALAQATGAHGVAASVAHGAVANVQTKSYGRLTLRLTPLADGPSPDFDAAVAAISELTQVEELAS